MVLSSSPGRFLEVSLPPHSTSLAQLILENLRVIHPALETLISERTALNSHLVGGALFKSSEESMMPTELERIMAAPEWALSLVIRNVAVWRQARGVPTTLSTNRDVPWERLSPAELCSEDVLAVL